jgi:hypothetical protein
VVQSWIRQALRASGVAILVPAAIVAAIAVSVVGGGGSARSLGQVLSGPAVPPAEAAQPPVAPRRDTEGSDPSVSARGEVAPRRAPSAAPAPQRTPAGAVPVRPRRPAPARPPASAAPAPAPAPSGPAPSAPPAPAPAPHPIHDTGSQVAETVRPLPVAGPVAADAVQAVVDLVDPPT